MCYPTPCLRFATMWPRGAMSPSPIGMRKGKRLGEPRSHAIVRLGQGNLSNVKSVGEGVLEFRIDFGPGYRVYFGREGEALVILLTGGTKRRQQRDIDAAHAYWRDYKQSKRGRRWRRTKMARTKSLKHLAQSH